MIYKIPQHGKIYVIPRKVASTSIRESIGLSVGEDISQKWGWKYRMEDLRDREGYEVIAFVRNPYDRLVSCYHNQCLQENRYNLGNCSFEEFVHHVRWTPYKQADKHFMLYWYIMSDKADRIIKYENLDKEWPSLGLPELKIKNKSNRKSWEKYYSDDLREKVYSYYLKDFVTYGYDK